ncbi:hypothetical protein M885DRAFT_206287 [Pelagophyceae sp. CCMP2097]|nr:hypothetical protein M885DRAFT_206287 [Pelagophyceae sp. CCMP2097]
MELSKGTVQRNCPKDRQRDRPRDRRATVRGTVRGTVLWARPGDVAERPQSRARQPSDRPGDRLGNRRQSDRRRGPSQRAVSETFKGTAQRNCPTGLPEGAPKRPSQDRPLAEAGVGLPLNGSRLPGCRVLAGPVFEWVRPLSQPRRRRVWSQRQPRDPSGAAQIGNPHRLAPRRRMHRFCCKGIASPFVPRGSPALEGRSVAPNPRGFPESAGA